MQFTYTITIDDDFTPHNGWTDVPGLEWETAYKINNGVWAAYGVIVRAAGPVESEESVWGCVVSLTDTGTYHELDAIMDDHLREIAKGLADEIEERYLSELIAKRDEINAMITRLRKV